MKIKPGLAICYALLGINFIFWLFMAAYYSIYVFSGDDEYFIIKVLLFLEPLAFLIIFFAVLKRVKLIYIASIPFLALNALLSITDEVGFYDILAMSLSILALILLLSIWRIIFKKKRKK